MRLHPRRTVGVALTISAALALVACGSSSSNSSSNTSTPATTPSTTSQPATGAASVVSLSADAGGALKFNTSTLSAKAGTVTLKMTNPSGSGLSHGIAVQGNGVDKDGKIVAPGGTSTDTVALKPGTYTFYCPVPGHKAAGMKGTLTVK